jgi:hypothetical protein
VLIPNFCYQVQNTQEFAAILNQMNPTQALPSYILKSVIYEDCRSEALFNIPWHVAEYGKECLAPFPTSKLEGQLLSSIHYCLLNALADTPHLEAFRSIRNLIMHHDMETWSHLTWTFKFLCDKEPVNVWWKLVLGPILVGDTFIPKW